jgi:hypothetical protein
MSNAERTLVLRPDCEVSIVISLEAGGAPRAFLTVHDGLPMTEDNALWTQGPIDGFGAEFWRTGTPEQLRRAAFPDDD